MFIEFQSDIPFIQKPSCFTYPFDYEVHPLCAVAAKQLQETVCANPTLAIEADRGKMFGVLVVEDDNGKLGYLAGFSGLIAGDNVHKGFVPPIYDLLDPKGYFRQGEDEINEINATISALEEDESYIYLKSELKACEETYKTWDVAYKQTLAEQKTARNEKRKESSLCDEDLALLLKQSQYEKAEYKRAKAERVAQIKHIKQQMHVVEFSICYYKDLRKTKSLSLQKQVFKSYKLYNARNEQKSVLDIFLDYNGQLPPAGTGECAAPKMLQYAYLNHLKPICMAEFWMGKSPKGELRREGYFYPSCMSKCYPILTFMMQGLSIDPDPKLAVVEKIYMPSILLEDDYILVVDKPAGMFTVPGKLTDASVYSWVKSVYPDIEEPIIVHRLDMATSGILVLAKTKQVHQLLQQLFLERKVQKTYYAVVVGVVNTDSGEIILPIRPDINDRPRQMVDSVHGKKAQTSYKVITRTPYTTLLELTPHTGRTHQLRVHCAHRDGLNSPILGDALYGTKADRMCLHAGKIEFAHPISKETIKIYSPHNFI